MYLTKCYFLPVYSWGGGSRGQLGHGTLSNEEKPRLVSALDGMRVRKIAAGGWHSAIISQFDDLYMFGWNESGQLAQPTNLTKPAECFSAVEKLLMACCTMQPEDAALPRGDAEDCEVYHKNDEKESSSVFEASEIEKVTLTLHVALIRSLIKLKGTAKLTVQGEQVCLKNSKYILFEILANRTWKGRTISCQPSKVDLAIWLAWLAGACTAFPCPNC